jgi:hypothetical protein
MINKGKFVLFLMNQITKQFLRSRNILFKCSRLSYRRYFESTLADQIRREINLIVLNSWSAKWIIWCSLNLLLPTFDQSYTNQYT